MKILGLGVDIIKNSRIKNSIKNKKFINKIFSVNEIRVAKNKKNKTAFYSKRFAVKEAFSKALGLGFRKKLNFKDISVLNKKNGKPEIIITKKLNLLVKKQFKTLKVNTLVSISDEKDYSIAFVIIEKK